MIVAAFKLYLETTLFTLQSAPAQYAELKSRSLQVFKLVESGKCTLYTSLLALHEVYAMDTKEQWENMLALIREYNIAILPSDTRSRRLAKLYAKEGAVQTGYPLDALHIALTTINELDALVSFNVEHIARPWTIERVDSVNARVMHHLSKKIV